MMGVACLQLVLFTQAPVCPHCGVVTRADLVELGDQSIAYFNRCLRSEDGLVGIRLDLSVVTDGSLSNRDLLSANSARHFLLRSASRGLASGRLA